MKIKYCAENGCLSKGIMGAILFLFGLIFLVFDPLAVVVKKVIQMREGSFVETLWMTVPVEMYNYIYVYNITNSEKFLRGEDDKIKLKELGPYVYKEERTNVNITFNENGTMTYTPMVSVPFQKHLSVGDIFNDTLVTFNLPLLGVLSMYSDAMYFKKMGMSLMINSFDPSPFVTLKINDYFWGYEDKMVDMLSTYMPNWIDFNKFGVLDRIYTSKRDVVTVNLDESRGSPYTIDYWNGSPGLKQWDYDGEDTSPSCSSLKDAYEGLMFPYKFAPENNSFTVYKKIFCRKLKLKQEGTITDHTGLTGNNYVIADGELTCKNPENSCYCTDDKPHELYDGVSDMSPCYYGIPFALSNPHFYDANPSYLEMFEGLNPKREDHFSKFILQTDVGLPIMGSVKVQLNLVMKDTRYNRLSRKFSDRVLPLMWIDSKLDKLPDHLMLLIRLAFVYLPVVQIILGWGLLVMGIALFFYNTISLMKPLQDWSERKTGSNYPGRLPDVELADRTNRRQNEDENTVFI